MGVTGAVVGVEQDAFEGLGSPETASALPLQYNGSPLHLGEIGTVRAAQAFLRPRNGTDIVVSVTEVM